MALTRVAPAGIGSTPGTGYVIGDSFLHSRGLNATDGYYTGIVTTQSLRVIGDLEVEGTTTTLDTALTEVDKLEVGANNNTVGVAITQSGTGDILNLYDGGTEVFSVTDGGKVKIGTETEGQANADNLTIADSNNCGITIRSGNTSGGAIYFSDGTSGGAEYDGYVEYSQNSRFMRFGTATQERLRIDAAGRIGIGTNNPQVQLHLTAADPYIRFQDTAAPAGHSQIMGTHQGALVLSADESGSVADSHLRFDVDGTERLRITSAGTLDITNPSSGNVINLGSSNVYANAAINIHRNGTGYADMRLASNYGVKVALAGASNNTDEFYIQQDNQKNAYIYNEAAKDIVFGTSNTARLRIDSSGRVLISGGAALTSTSQPHPLQIAAASDASAVVIFGRASDDIGELSYFEADKTTRLGELQYRQDHVNFRHRKGDIRFWTHPTGGTIERLRIKSDGQININAFSESLGGKVLIRNDVNYNSTDFDDDPTLFLLNGDQTTGVSEAAIVLAGRNTGGSTFRAAISGNGSTGLKFYTSSNAELDDTPAMLINGSGNVGIGTDSMTSALQIYAADTGEGTAKGQITLKDTAAYNQTPTGGIVFQGHHTAGAQAIFAGIRGFKANTGNGDYDGCLAFDVRKHGAVAYEAMRINEDGKIGVGVASPQQKLDVVGSANAVAVFRPDTNTTSAYGDASVVNNLINLRMPYGSNPGSANNNGARWGIKFQGRNDGNEYGTDAGKSASIYAVSEDTTAGYNRQVGLAFYTSPFDANQTERLRIASDGQATFDKGAPSGANQVIARFQAESSRRLDIVWHDSGSLMGFDTPSNHSYIFKTNGSEKLRIGSTGHISYLNNSPPAWQVNTGYANMTFGSSGWLRTDTDVNSNFMSIGINAYRSSGGWKHVNSGYATQLQQSANDGHLTYYTSTVSGNADAAITWNQVIRVTLNEVGINVTPSAGDGATYNNWSVPKLHVKGNSDSNKFHLVGRFHAGNDADSTGAQIVIHHENDRGMALQGGRSSGNRSYGAIKSLDNLARESNVMVFTGGSGQGVENIKFYTNGGSTGTNERMSINTHGTVHTGGSTEITQTSLKPDLITQAGVVSPMFYRPFQSMSGAPSTSGPGYVDFGTGGVRHNLTDPHLGASYGGSQFQGGLINSYSQTFSNTASGTTREAMNWNRFRILFRGLCLSTGHTPPTVKFRYSTYHYSNGWTDHSGTEWSFNGTEQARGGRWVVGPWIDPSSYFTNWADVPGFGLYYNDNSSGKTFRIAGGVYFQFAHFI